MTPFELFQERGLSPLDGNRVENKREIHGHSRVYAKHFFLCDLSERGRFREIQSQR